ncbi:MAG: ATP-dependent DNA helicase RecG [Clostridiales bacterium]|nr:ATP-dependent DNA helicase RecG [Clostridiales bacterium]
MKVKQLKGVGPKKEKLLSEMELLETDDLLYYFPTKYIDKSVLYNLAQLKSGDSAVIKGTVVDLKVRKNYGKKDMLVLKVESDGFIGEAIFFQADYLKNKFKFQHEYYIFGKIDISGKTFKVIHPEMVESVQENFLGIEPVYKIPGELSQKNMRDFIRQSLSFEIQEILPEFFIEKNKLCSRKYALENIHFPENRIKFKESKYRLIYEEFFNFILGNYLIKEADAYKNGHRFKNFENQIENLTSSLPFKLTHDQMIVMNEIIADLEDKKPMRRLLQGDVGSGKTIVGIIASYLSFLNQFQTAVMVPTEILAVQHYNNFRNILPDELRIILLTSSVADKEEIHELIRDGQADIIIGTHALIQESVSFKKLGLIITDEQHRFGVNQRKILIDKNEKANYLMMSATPIPRTVAMVLYSDISVSTIKELPKGRKPIKTVILKENQQNKLIEAIKNQLNENKQGYIVFPFIEDSEHFDQVKSIQNGYEEIKANFSEYRTAVVHGQLKFEEREQILKDFKDHQYDILVSTTVIEVGIDIPNASFIVVYNAERFGLSQLHQLRGRVGRGVWDSCCYLVSNGNTDRLKAMSDSNDGFVLAQKDLEIRGPGEVLGIKQHGTNHFLIADLFKHQTIMEKTVEDVEELFENREKFKIYLQKYNQSIFV